MIAAWAPLATARIAAIFDEIIEVNDRPGMRVFNERIPMVDAEDGDIFARVQNLVTVAEIIETDQAAVIKADEPIRLQTTAIPKIKHGRMLSETKLLLIKRIEDNLATNAERVGFDDYVANSLRLLLNGVDDRRELLLCQMVTNSATYNKYGIQFSGLSWGTPAGLITTPSTLWSNVNSTPVSDLLTARQYGETTYGEVYNRVTMSTQALKYALATTEFQTQVKLLVPLAGIANLSVLTGNLDAMSNILGQMIGMTIERYDRRTREEAADGSRSTVRFWPENMVGLTDTNDDNDPNTWDFANGIMPETIPGMVPHLVGYEDYPGGEQSGPIAYVTAADPQGNPPGLVMWSGQRGFPRKHRETASSVLTVY